MQKNQKPRLHFEDGIVRPEVFRITPERLAAARRRNAAAAKLVRVSRGVDLAEIDHWLPRIDALACSGGFLSDARFPLRRLAVAAPRLKWIHVTGAGIENLLPLDWLPRGVALTNNSGVHAPKTYEFGLMSLLMLASRVPEIQANQRKARWQQIFTTTPRGKALLVVGMGELGGAVARAGRTLGMQVTGLRRREQHRLHALLPAADIVYLAAPLTPDTRGMMGRREFALMKPGAAIANIGRGPLIRTPALIAALRSGRLSGAVLDVHDPEPLPAGSPLWKTPNVYISPHCSSDDAETYIPRTLDLVFDNARRFVRGQKLRNAVDPKRGY
ncbi:MAG: D-2-hydroxyacid dehydrogenase [Burkholderiales bacterium]